MTLSRPKIDLTHCILYIYNDNIVLMKIKRDAVIDLKNSIIITDSIMKLVNYKSFKIIVDAKDIFGSFTIEARNHFANTRKYNQLRLKSAIIVNNLPVRLLINIYQKFHLKKDNFKIVKDLDEALNFLNK